MRLAKVYNPEALLLGTYNMPENLGSKTLESADQIQQALISSLGKMGVQQNL